MPQRLWERLVTSAGIAATTPWNGVSNAALNTLATQLTAAELKVVGKSLFKDEFVTCGGVKLSEVDFRTMESRVCPGLHFAGEVLDIDGVTGGFNFQAAWTTSRIAGQAMAGAQAQPGVGTERGTPQKSTPPAAKVSEEQATKIALERIPGTVTSVTIERKRGKRVYVVEIQTPGGERDVFVDITSGKIVGTE